MPDFIDTGNYDYLASSSSLQRLRLNRAFFDPTNQTHLDSMKHYMLTGNWLTQFYPEAPYIDVPMTVFRKFAGHHLNVDVTEAQKEAANPGPWALFKGPVPISSLPDLQAIIKKKLGDGTLSITGNAVAQEPT